MIYEKIVRGKFIERPNRFIANVEIGGKLCKAHVKNTGRCKELLMPGADIWLEDFTGRMGNRKLRYSLVGVNKKTPYGEIAVNMDSQAPNKVVKEALLSGKILPGGLVDIDFVKGEYVYGDSRLDFYVRDSLGKEALIEVKGVTLEDDGVAMFPDAPTERGVKHIKELIKARAEGYEVCVIFVIQMKGIDKFIPNNKAHKEFGDILRQAKDKGVEIIAVDCIVDETSLNVDKSIKVEV